MNAREELERIIREGMRGRITHATIDGGEEIVITETCATRIEGTAQAILDKLPKLVETDEGKLVNMLVSYIVKKNIHIRTMCGDEKEVPLDILRDLTKAIASVKGIIKIKEQR